MIIIPELLLEYLNSKKLTPEKFAEIIAVPTGEIEKLLAGQAVERPIAKKFVFYFGAYKAQFFVDWNAIGKTNPLIDDLVFYRKNKEITRMTQNRDLAVEVKSNFLRYGKMICNNVE